jgi:hypothetical protein
VNNERLATITYLAMDDLAEGHADLPTILRVAASLGWREGRREAERVRAEQGHARQPALPVPRGSSEQTGFDTEPPLIPADHNT